MHGYARDAVRDPKVIGFETWVSAHDVESGRAASKVADWQEFGATHVGVVTMGAGYESVAEHIKAIETFMTEVDSRLNF